ncbi:hypothetical protein D3C73_1415660 [compost metagenome]
MSANAHLLLSCWKNRPLILIPEQSIGCAPHVQDVLRVSADTAQDAEHRLDQEGWFDEAAIDEMCGRVEMPDVITFDLESGAVFTA